MDINQFEPNSHKYNKDKDRPEKTKLEPVVAGQAHRRSLGRRFAKTFFTEDTKDVKGYLIFDVLIPAIKDTLVNMITGGANMLFYGDNRGNSRNRSNYNPYRNDVSRQASATRTSSYSPSGRRRMLNNFDDIALSSRAECQQVLDAMNEAIYTYGSVSVADLYDLVNMSRESEFTDNKFGWVDLTGAGYSRLSNGQYVLDLPKVVDLK